MRQIMKRFLCVALLATGWQTSWGFALLGPGSGGGAGGDSWETPIIGYGLSGDIGTPKNIGEEYRRNTPVMYYAYNENFSGFFGSNGEAAVDSAFAIMNNTFTNNPLTGQYLTNGVDGLSASLSEYPLNSAAYNFEAQGLGLTDLKSAALMLLVEQMGLAQPERYTWTLHDRYLPTTPSGLKCPEDELYLVIQRNFDVITSPLNQIQYSPYVNDTLYSYEIAEHCVPPNPLAVTVPLNTDPYANISAVAGLGGGLGVDESDTNGEWGAYMVGGFYTGLTRDDVGGLRYLLTTNNVNWEDPAPGSVLISSSGGGGGGVSYGSPFVLYTSNYTAFALAALTNNPVTLATLFPGLVVTSSSYYFTNIATPNIVAYYTNYIGAPAGSPPTLVVTTNGYTYSYPAIYSDTFANVVIISYHTNTSATLVTITVGVKIGAPVGSPLVTNTTSTKITLTNVPSGDYYINTNYLCGTNIILSTLGTNVVATTNLLVTGTNSRGYSYSQSLVTYSTNHVFVAESPICAVASTNTTTTNSAAVGDYQGIGGVQFMRVPDTYLDPLSGNFIQPITNTYTMEWFNPTNSQVSVRTFQRIVTHPDILFSATDMATPNTSPEIGVKYDSRSINFDINNILPGLAGPGTIIPATTITFNKVGDIFGNGSLDMNNLSTNQFLSQINQFGLLAWASFDASTNDPVVYPNGTSIQNLENQLIITISPPSLPDGANGAPYGATFSAIGGTPPYTWSLASGSQPLPLGLTFSGGVISGTPSGNAPGTYDFTIQLADSEPGIPRVVDLNYSITIDY
jgi:hypothetical protein